MKLLAIFIGICLTVFSYACKTKPQALQKKDTDSIYKFSQPSPDGIGKFYFDREIAHVMGAAGASWLERVEREKEEGTAKVIANLSLPPNANVADIGAGTGYYTFRIASQIPQGTIYAVDIQDEMLAILKSQAISKKINNVKVVKGSETNPNLPPSSIDLAIMVDVYHELAYPHEMLQAIYKALKPGGQLLLLEYKGEDPSIAIKPLHKMTVEQTKKELNANGFKVKNVGDFLPIQHFLLFNKE